MSASMFSRLPMFIRLKAHPSTFRILSSSSRPMVKHDRQNRRFTVALRGAAGDHTCAVLSYRFTGEKEVDLMSTYVPEMFRGQGVAALLSQSIFNMIPIEDQKNLPEDENTPEKRAEKIWEFFGKKDNDKISEGEFIQGVMDNKDILRLIQYDEPQKIKDKLKEKKQ